MDGEVTALDAARALMAEAKEGELEDSDSQESSHRRPSQATLIIELANAEFWHNPDGEAFAAITVGDHLENWLVKSRGFRQWLRKLYWDAYRAAPSSQAVQDALGVLEGKALFEGEEHSAFIRLAEFDGSIYLDLANEKWEVVVINAEGWSVVSDAPVKFRRTKGMMALPYPASNGEISVFRQFINVESDRDWTLLVSWLVASLWPHGPYPILVLHGEQGSAKSTLAEFLHLTVDPNTTPLRTQPRDERDLMIAATNAWCLMFDNLSSLRPWVSDALCRLATGGGFSTRTLYENSEETLFNAQRPVVLNGIEELATRGDLLDRSIILYLPSIPKRKRVKIKTLRQQFEKARPGILGALLDVISAVMRNLPGVETAELPRMADFAALGIAAETALGFQRGTFLEAYGGNLDDANTLVLDASPIGQPIRELAAKGDWTGTMSELLAKLNGEVDEPMRKLESWPKDGTRLSNAIRRIVPNLREVGVDVSFGQETTGKRRRIIAIRKGMQDSDSSDSSPHPDGRKGDNTGVDGRDARRDADADIASPKDMSSVSSSEPQYEAVNEPDGDAGDARDAEIHIYSSGSDDDFDEERF